MTLVVLHYVGLWLLSGLLSGLILSSVDMMLFDDEFSQDNLVEIFILMVIGPFAFLYMLGNIFYSLYWLYKEKKEEVECSSGDKYIKVVCNGLTDEEVEEIKELIEISLSEKILSKKE